MARTVHNKCIIAADCPAFCRNQERHEGETCSDYPGLIDNCAVGKPCSCFCYINGTPGHVSSPCTRGYDDSQICDNWCKDQQVIFNEKCHSIGWDSCAFPGLYKCHCECSDGLPPDAGSDIF